MAMLKYDGSPAAVTASAKTNLYGTSEVDTLVGGPGPDSLWGGQGDHMTGGAGDDTYYVKSNKDVVVEGPGGGVDRIVSWLNTSLADHPYVENLTVQGDGRYAAGNAQDNIVQGGEGSQQIYGGGGQDVLVGGAGADVFIVYKGEGNDVIQDFRPGEDIVRLKAGLGSFDQVQARLSQRGADAHIDLGDGHGLILRKVDVGALSARDFQLELDPGRLGLPTFADEFNGPLSLWNKTHAPHGVWRADFGFQGLDGKGSYTLVNNGEKQIYTSPFFRGHPGDFTETPFVSNPDGTLSIWARASSNPEIFGFGYTSGLITTKQSFAQTYGYFEIRADVPEAAGAWPAFWLVPADGSWPPELDVMESLGRDARAAWTSQHSAVGGHTTKGAAAFVPDSPDGMHTYGVLWSPTELVWRIDGVEVFRTPTPADMHKPMFILANMALGGWGGAIDPKAFPAEFKIDYIRAYSWEDYLANSQAAAPPAFAQILHGGAHDDVFVGVAGSNYMRGGDGRDSLTGGEAFDDLQGNAGDDTVRGGGGADWVVGGKDNDSLFGDGGDDVVYGNMGQDTCYGGYGDDLIRGGKDDDHLYGEAGDDWLSGDRGDDVIVGGPGADVFYSFAEAGIDRVMDFNRAEGDRVQLAPGSVYSVSQVGEDVVIAIEGGAQMILAGVSMSALTGEWLFVA